ncbi:MAG: hypothetical protein HDS57_03650 [Barnesiella sp.]|nr:hypothetical protein [Barnesiella sp.]
MNRISVIIRGNLLCKGDVSVYPNNDITVLRSPADIVIPKVFRLNGEVYDTTNAAVITGDVTVAGNLITAPSNGGVLVTGDGMAYTPDTFLPEKYTKYAPLEAIEV